MEKNEADKILIEIVEACENLSLECFNVTEKKLDNSYTSGYAVFIKAFLGNVRKQEVLKIAKNHGLSIREEKEALIVYKPKSL